MSIEVSEVLYAAIQIAAAMAATTVPAFIGPALRETQIAFFAENRESLSDVVVLDVREAMQLHPGIRRRGGVATLQLAILHGLVDVPDQPGVFDLHETGRAMLNHSRPPVSRAVHKLVKNGFLEPTSKPSGTALRYVRRGSHSGTANARP